MTLLDIEYAGGVIEMSEFSLFIRNQAKEAERKLKVHVYSLQTCSA
jgi:hypothetical protein